MSASGFFDSAAERRNFLLVALAGFTAAAVAAAPATVGVWALRRAAPMLAVAGAEGTLWSGRLSGLSYGGVLIGDVNYRLSAPSLLLGKISIHADSSNGALLGKARVLLGQGRADLRDVSVEFNLGAIRQYTFFGVRYQGFARLKADRLTLSDGVCAAEGATVSTSAFEALTKRWSGSPLPLDGAIACEGGALVVALNGESADGKAAVGLTIRPDFNYMVRIAAETRRDDVSRALQLFGFEDKGEQLSYEAAGVLKGLSS